MSGIKLNAGYNSPELAAVAENIVGMFGPPPASDLASYSVAAKNRQEVDHRARLAQIALDPNSSWDRIDRAGLGYQGWTPNQSFEGIDRNNETQRYGYDTQAATQRANNFDDNKTDIIKTLYGSRDPYHTQPMLPGDIASSFGLSEIPEMAGIPKPMTESEWKAFEGQRLVDEGQISDAALIDMITDGGEGSTKQQQIERLKQNFLATGAFVDPSEAYNAAVGIADGRYHMSSDPITGEVLITDLATRQPVGPVAIPPPGPSMDPAAGGAPPDYVPTGDPVIDAVMAPTGLQVGPTVAAAGAGNYPDPYPAAEKAFGLTGWGEGGINRVADGLGMEVPYPDTMQTQADFNVLRENLLNAVQDAYGRQPPSWLMQRLDQLTPDTGNPFEGVGQARSEMESLGRAFAGDLESAQAALETRLTPSARMEAEAKVRGLQKALGELNIALERMPGLAAPTAPVSEPDADGWITAPNGARIREVQ